MMIRNIVFIGFVLLASCNWFKEKTKETVNKTGEVVAQTGSEFVDGVSKGVEKSFKNEIIISDDLKQKGLNVGKVIINSSDTSTDNILTAYLIFDKDFNQNLVVKIFNDDNKEYGRVTKEIKTKKGEAKYFDFVFDKRTNIDGRGKIIVE
ncbi:MAG: hypothetical protein RL065_33 [Bacteroidota bacterium]|jgi:hypothetical protein